MAGRFAKVALAGALFLWTGSARGQIADITTVGPGGGVDGGVTFQTHNQKVVENGRGIFLTHGGFRLQRSTDGGRTFSTVYEEAFPVSAPAIETDEDVNLYLTFPDTGRRRTRFLKFTPGNYGTPAVNAGTGAATSAAKFISFYDRSRGLIYHGTQWGYCTPHHPRAQGASEVGGGRVGKFYEFSAIRKRRNFS